MELMFMGPWVRGRAFLMASLKWPSSISTCWRRPKCWAVVFQSKGFAPAFRNSSLSSKQNTSSLYHVNYCQLWLFHPFPILIQRIRFISCRIWLSSSDLVPCPSYILIDVIFLYGFLMWYKIWGISAHS